MCVTFKKSVQTNIPQQQAAGVRPYFKSFSVYSVFSFCFPFILSTTKFRAKGHNSRYLIYKGFYNYSVLLIVNNKKTSPSDISRSFGNES